jgi:hypothetical protein
MLTPTPLQPLAVPAFGHPRGQPHVSAASGLVRVGAWLYLVADDEHHFGRLAEQGGAVHLHRLREGDLPNEKHRRKQLKPDLEALAFLPAVDGHTNGALLALGSGSTPQREVAFLCGVDGEGLPAGKPRAIDLVNIYRPLRSVFPDLNVEGAFVAGESFHLLHRGNRGDARNASIAYPLAAMLAWLAGPGGEPPPGRIAEMALGEVNGVPLGFTDGTALPGGGWIFSAAAEDTSDSYNDGRCAGSAIGWVSAQGQLLRMEAITGSPKVEGIAFAGDGRLLMVTDSDDPDTASQLLALQLS